MKIVRGYTDQGTFGQWYDDDGEFICHSLERPWKNNEPFVSCIPEGVYGLVEYDSPKFGLTFALVNHDLGVGVYEGDAHRYGILFHGANWPHQLEGCIAPGTALSVLHDQWAVSASQAALAKVMEKIRAGDTTQEITHAEAHWTPADLVA